MARVDRLNGTVKWFDVCKGFGFITPDDGGEDLFVHKSSIKAHNYRWLDDGEAVKFVIAKGEDGRTMAAEVTGFRCDVSCYSCGEMGHISRDCKSDGGCFTCGVMGHFARECPSRPKSPPQRKGNGGTNGGGRHSNGDLASLGGGTGLAMADYPLLGTGGADFSAVRSQSMVKALVSKVEGSGSATQIVAGQSSRLVQDGRGESQQQRAVPPLATVCTAQQCSCKRVVEVDSSDEVMSDETSGSWSSEGSSSGSEIQADSDAELDLDRAATSKGNLDLPDGLNDVVMTRDEAAGSSSSAESSSGSEIQADGDAKLDLDTAATSTGNSDPPDGLNDVDMTVPPLAFDGVCRPSNGDRASPGGGTGLAMADYPHSGNGGVDSSVVRSPSMVKALVSNIEGSGCAFQIGAGQVGWLLDGSRELVHDGGDESRQQGVIPLLATVWTGQQSSGNGAVDSCDEVTSDEASGSSSSAGSSSGSEIQADGDAELVLNRAATSTGNPDPPDGLNDVEMTSDEASGSSSSEGSSSGSEIQVDGDAELVLDREETATGNPDPPDGLNDVDMTSDEAAGSSSSAGSSSGSEIQVDGDVELDLDRAATATGNPDPPDGLNDVDMTSDEAAGSSSSAGSSSGSEIQVDGDVELDLDRAATATGNPDPPDGLNDLNMRVPPLAFDGVGVDPFGNGKTSPQSCPSPVRSNAPPKSGDTAYSGGVPLALRQDSYVVFQKTGNIKDYSPDGKSVTMDDDIVDQNIGKFDNALVGKLLGCRLQFSYLNAELRQKWLLFGEFQLILMRDDCFICIFNSLTARDSILRGGPWFINGHVIGLDTWSPDFNPSCMKGLFTPIWVRLPSLPLIFWDPTNLGRIASMVGEPLWMDSVTSSWGPDSPVMYARVCVKADLSKPLPPGVWVHSKYQSFFQATEYEGLPSQCYHCGCVGHSMKTCPVRTAESWAPSTHPVNAPPVRSPDNTAAKTPSIEPDKEVHERIVSNNRKGKQKTVAPAASMEDVPNADFHPVANAHHEVGGTSQRKGDGSTNGGGRHNNSERASPRGGTDSSVVGSQSMVNALASKIEGLGSATQIVAGQSGQLVQDGGGESQPQGANPPPVTGWMGKQSSGKRAVDSSDEVMSDEAAGSSSSAGGSSGSEIQADGSAELDLDRAATLTGNLDPPDGLNVVDMTVPLLAFYGVGVDLFGNRKTSPPSCPSPVHSNSPPKSGETAYSGVVTPAWRWDSYVAFQKTGNIKDYSQHGKSVTMDDDIVDQNIGKFDNALVGKLLGRRLQFSYLNAELRRKWLPFGEFRLILIRNDCFICIFNSLTVRDSILRGGPWFINGYVIGLDTWSPDFNPSSMKGFFTPIWVRLPSLPLIFWDPTNLGRIASMVGEPLWMDSVTSSWGPDRPVAYSRVCVKADLSKPLPPGVWVHSKYQSFFQPTEYEGLSSLCYHCGCVGHSMKTCPVRMAESEEPSTHLVNTPPVTSVNPSLPGVAVPPPDNSTANTPSMEPDKEVHELIVSNNRKGMHKVTAMPAASVEVPNADVRHVANIHLEVGRTSNGFFPDIPADEPPKILKQMQPRGTKKLVERAIFLGPPCLVRLKKLKKTVRKSTVKFTSNAIGNEALLE
ncbi:Cold shock protein 1 [Platanthera zijinensis]|uniref:Cold shock protein 1 n=1 Tax=Platanthera zijinensis TaxID=2320716 RepID=A0AAP0BWY1_9ASPA